MTTQKGDIILTDLWGNQRTISADSNEVLRWLVDDLSPYVMVMRINSGRPKGAGGKIAPYACYRWYYKSLKQQENGVLDVMLICKDNIVIPVEIKSEKDTLNANQRRYIEQLEALNTVYYVICPSNYVETVNHIKRWLGVRVE